MVQQLPLIVTCTLSVFAFRENLYRAASLLNIRHATQKTTGMHRFANFSYTIRRNLQKTAKPQATYACCSKSVDGREC